MMRRLIGVSLKAQQLQNNDYLTPQMESYAVTKEDETTFYVKNEHGEDFSIPKDSVADVVRDDAGGVQTFVIDDGDAASLRQQFTKFRDAVGIRNHNLARLYSMQAHSVAPITPEPTKFESGAYQVDLRADSKGNYSETIHALDVYDDNGKMKFVYKDTGRELPPTRSGYSKPGNVRHIGNQSLHGQVRVGVIVFDNPKAKLPEARGYMMGEIKDKNWLKSDDIISKIKANGEYEATKNLVAAERREEERVARQSAPRCEVCGRPLTTPESIARGRGPECAGK